MPRPNLADDAPNVTTVCRATAVTTFLMEAFDTETNRRCVIVVAGSVVREDAPIQITPLARMFDGDPYERIAPPHPETPGAYSTHDGKAITDADAERLAAITSSDHDTVNQIARIIADRAGQTITHEIANDEIAALLRANGRDRTPTHEYPDPPTH